MSTIDEELLAEVNNLVEWPSAVACTFEEEFLAVPHAALVASMQDHQKFFPVRDAANPDRVTNRFIAISNVDRPRNCSASASVQECRGCVLLRPEHQALVLGDCARVLLRCRPRRR